MKWGGIDHFFEKTVSTGNERMVHLPLQVKNRLIGQSRVASFTAASQKSPQWAIKGSFIYRCKSKITSMGNQRLLHLPHQAKNYLHGQSKAASFTASSKRLPPWAIKGSFIYRCKSKITSMGNQGQLHLPLPAKNHLYGQSRAASFTASTKNTHTSAMKAI
ncbi:hypothetical protein M3610_13170 [Neobacillus sp. MER 74]|uniref:hypothetical protein n=1 Tax=Neobacillus sp. MER 74 TaxID=2939566 RepID=UPI002041D749|nr:hypothetical protein [Neobacillus sp. MER 74]MCM3116250.1 hypothetical protein [Neobacillus sp. MER 74]